MRLGGCADGCRFHLDLLEDEVVRMQCLDPSRAL